MAIQDIYDNMRFTVCLECFFVGQIKRHPVNAEQEVLSACTDLGHAH